MLFFLIAIFYVGVFSVAVDRFSFPLYQTLEKKNNQDSFAFAAFIYVYDIYIVSEKKKPL